MNKGLALKTFAVQGWLRLDEYEAVEAWLASGKPLVTVRHGVFTPSRFTGADEALALLLPNKAVMSQLVNTYRLPLSPRPTRILATDGFSAAKQYARTLGIRESDWLDKGTGLVVVQVEDAP